MENNTYFYANGPATIFSTESDFVIQLTNVLPKVGEKGVILPGEKQELHVILSPIQFKKICKAMDSRLNDFEKAAGEIMLTKKPVKQHGRYMNEPDIVFTTTDRDGCAITLHSTQFKNHIQKQHPELCNPNAIKYTIVNAECITEDKDYKTTTNYYNSSHKYKKLKKRGKYIKVAVDFSSGELSGRVKTAFPTTEVHPKDKIVWKKSEAK